MDDIVKAALAKWPNVPHCTGWLLLDRRGAWRMRDERAQALGELGAPVRHVALLGFINRNYECDERGMWFFQNGPQRVYVELAYTPWVVRLALTDRDGKRTLTLTDQTGGAFEPRSALIDEEGAVLFVDAATRPRVALLHDHDLDLFSDFASLGDDGGVGRFHWCDGQDLPIETIARADVASRFGFVASPASAGVGATHSSGD
ncbi:DUF2946 family protein [Trinickia sp. EG282A]|uniref:DUF2946 family protein n=1 Tax=Trinickia sp. EG282A TaxID=3237013 RepID=UPI0034D30EB0